MTVISLIYFALGLVALIWPIALLIVKRRVLGAQWLLGVAMMMLSITFILHSCLFNNFLTGEYLLVVLYMMFALFTPPTTMLAIASLTSPQGAGRIVKALFIPAIVISLLLAASVVIGGSDMYRLWIYRGSVFEAHYFYPNSWRYNVIVFVHLYLFSLILVLEGIILTIFTIFRFSRYRKTVREYYAHDPQRPIIGNTYFISVAALGILSALSLFLYPFNAPRPVDTTLVLALMQGVVIFILGYHIYHLDYGAELLGQRLKGSGQRTRKDLVALGKEISSHIEHQAYLDPDLSVFSLAARFHVSQDQVVDAIHKTQGMSFADYVDGLRVEYAEKQMLIADDTEDPDFLNRIAHQSGYLDAAALQRAYRKIMRKELKVEN